MFRRSNNLIVTQWEHSHLSGRLAALLGKAAGVCNPELFGAIALHDWPHFAMTGLTDEIVIGDKTVQQQRELLGRLAQPLPLEPYTELIVRLHWSRLSQGDPDLCEVLDQQRLETLRQQLGFSHAQLERLDRWTDLCDTLAFYLSRGESATGSDELPDPDRDRSNWDLHWVVSPDSLEVRGLPRPYRSEIMLLTFQSEGYPEQLKPAVLDIACVFAAEAG